MSASDEAVERLEARCSRAEEEYPRLSAPDGTVAVPFTDLRTLLNLANHTAAMKEALEEAREALRPFANHVGKSGAPVILTIGADRWTETLTTDDFERLRSVRAKIAALSSAPLEGRK